MILHNVTVVKLTFLHKFARTSTFVSAQDGMLPSDVKHVTWFHIDKRSEELIIQGHSLSGTQ